MSEFAQYLNLPWIEGGRGPEGYDCYGFVQMIQKAHFGIEMSDVAVPDYDDGQAILGLINECGERADWEPVKIPMHGDIAIVRRPIHVGVWLNIDRGGILHCIRGFKVVFSHDASWHCSGFGRRTFLRHRSRM